MLLPILVCSAVGTVVVGGDALAGVGVRGRGRVGVSLLSLRQWKGEGGRRRSCLRLCFEIGIGERIEAAIVSLVVGRIVLLLVPRRRAQALWWWLGLG